MKLSKMLISSGTLQRNQIRHCSEWEFSTELHGSRFGKSIFLRRVMSRRARRIAARKPGGILGKIPACLGWSVRK